MPTIEMTAWMQARPDTVKALMRWFPPGCSVASKDIDLLCPRPGQVATVISYFEDGSMTVGVEGSDLRHQVQVSWVKVVGYYVNELGETQDGEWVRRVLNT